MAIKTIECTIKGKTSLLMHSFPFTPIEALEKRSPEEQAEFAAYRDPDTGDLYIPGINFQRALIAGATFSKGKGRASLQKQVAACVMVQPERASLGVKEYKVDGQPVVIPATKGRVMRYRPRLDDWQVIFSIEFDNDLLTEEQLRRVIDDTGNRVGLLDFRPEKKGFHGRFMVIEWK